VELASHGSHGLGGVEQEVCCGETEGDDDLGIDDTDLFDQVRGAAVGLVWGWGGVVGGSCFEDICDVDGFAGESHRDDHFFEELAGASDEGATGFVFLLTRGFSDEHEVGGWGALAEDDVGEGIVEGRVGGVGGVLVFEGIEFGLGIIE